MAARLSSPLFQLRAEANAANPNRDKASDGWISDAAHAQRGYPTTKHSANPRGVVHAIDLDKDGVDMPRMIAIFQADPRSHLWIFNRQIALRREGWRRRSYSGPNPHDKHGHFEDQDSAAVENDSRPWGYAGGTTPAPSPTAGGGISRFATVRQSRTASATARTLQRAANKLGARLSVDGVPGPKTIAWVRAFQTQYKLGADGVVGKKTWAAIAQALLNAHGQAIVVDGDFGTRSKAATRAVQQRYGLSPDGIFGPNTLARLVA